MRPSRRGDETEGHLVEMARKNTTNGADRRLNRLIGLAAVVLVVGAVLVGVAYFLDQRVDPGLSLADRRVVAAEAAVQEKPDDVGLRLALALSYRAAERPDDALAQFDTVIAAQADNKIALNAKAEILEGRGDLAGAQPLYQKVVDVAKDGEFAGMDTELARAYYGLASIAMAQSRPADAVTALEAAVRIGGTDADAWHLLGTAQLAAGNPDKAIEAEQNAITFVPVGWGEPYQVMADAYTAQGKPEYAEYANAMVDFAAGRNDQARQRLTALTGGPAALEAWVGLGLVTEKLGDTQAAIDAYGKALEIDKNNFTAQGGLARLVGDTGQSAAPASAAPSAAAESEG
jgi:tetratricopeptide (TPR) repeat protein